MEMVRKIAIASQGVHAMMHKITAETAEEESDSFSEPPPFADVESAVDANDMLSKFEKLIARSSLLEIAEEQARGRVPSHSHTKKKTKHKKHPAFNTRALHTRLSHFSHRQL